MYQRVKYDFKQELIKIKDSGLFKEERTILSSQKPEIQRPVPRRLGSQGSAELLFQQLPGAGQPSRHHPRRPRGAGPLRLRPGLGALHLRHPGPAQAAGGEDLAVLRDRGHHPLFLLLRRQRRPVRKPAGHRGRHRHRRPQPRQHHRRHPPVQGQALHLRAFRHDVAGERPEKGPRGHGHLGRPRPGQGAGPGAQYPDRHRRRLFHGRRHRRRARHHQAGQPV